MLEAEISENPRGPKQTMHMEVNSPPSISTTNSSRCGMAGVNWL
jgi:hypothetical protein